MYKTITILMLGFMLAALPCAAGGIQNNDGTQISTILDHKTTLSLTDSQVKKLEIVQRTTTEKMTQAKLQADIRMGEIEKFTSDWSNMNSIAVLSLVKEYFKYMTDYKTAEVEAVVQARAILDINQLTKFQQLVSIESMMVRMEQSLALR
jgi:hypothetical protein